MGVGRPARAVGVDLGGTNARAALVDLDADGAAGTILADEKKAVPLADRGPAEVAELVAELVGRVDPSGEGVRGGVGMGIAAMLRGWTGVVVNAPNLGWREADFRALLRERLGPRVELYNDLNAIAYGEATFGAARGAKDVLCVFVGTGIGAGLVTGGTLYIGATHLAGEIGHTRVAPGGRLCGCGARGCVEAYVSGVHLAARAREELSLPGARSLALELAGSLERLHAGHLDEAARAGDVYASSLLAEVAPLLGRVLANAVTLLNPSHLVMGGGVWEGAPELARRVLESFHELVNAPSAEGLAIVRGALGDNAGVLGAAALIADGVCHP